LCSNIRDFIDVPDGIRRKEEEEEMALLGPLVEQEELVPPAMERPARKAGLRHSLDAALLSLNFGLAKICQNTFCLRLRMGDALTRPGSTKNFVRNRKPIVQASVITGAFDFNISGGPSTANKAPSLRDLNRRVITPATNNAKANNNATFLTLPVEIRLRVYDLLLVSRFDCTQNPSWAVRNTYQKLVLLYMIQALQYRTMEPGILRTCKQVYHEANTILYSQNVFAISEPEQMFRFVVQVGLVNVKLV
jgi:hypothetical protein